MKITLVHNPGAGIEQPPKEKIMEALQGEGIEINYVSSKENDLNESLLSQVRDVVVVAGGDGTIRKVARLLLDKHVPLAVMPLGTANNIALTLESPVAFAHENTYWMNQETCRFDAGVVYKQGDKEYFIESVGFGAFAEMVHRIRQAKKKEQFSFDSPEEELTYIQAYLQDLLRSLPACACQLTIDGEQFSGNYVLVEVMNTCFIGPHLQLSPKASPGDGLLDVVLIEEKDKEGLIQYVEAIRQGKEEHVHFPVKRGRHITVVSDWKRYHIDDELISYKDEEAVEIAVKPQALSMFRHAYKIE